MNVNNASVDTKREFIKELDLEGREKDAIYILSEKNKHLEKEQAEKGNFLPGRWKAETALPVNHNGVTDIIYNGSMENKEDFKKSTVQNPRETIVHMALFQTVKPNPLPKL